MAWGKTHENFRARIRTAKFLNYFAKKVAFDETRFKKKKKKEKLSSQRILKFT